MAFSDTLQLRSHSPFLSNFKGNITFINGLHAHTRTPICAGVVFKRGTSLHALSNLYFPSHGTVHVNSTDQIYLSKLEKIEKEIAHSLRATLIITALLILLVVPARDFLLFTR